MEEFTNEFALARNFGFDITMPEGNIGLSSAAHMEYMNKCTALYRNFITNMNSIIRFEKETKKNLSKLHKEKIDNLRFSLYRSANANNTNDPFAKARETMSVSYTGLDSRQNTPWGLGTVPHEADEEKDVRPHTAPAIVLKRSHSSQKVQRSGDGDLTDNGDNEEDQLSTTGLSDPGGMTDKIVLGILDTKTERKITVGQHCFAKLGNRSVKAKLKNRDGLFKVTPLNVPLENNASNTMAIDPNKSNIDYDPVNEKVAMVKGETSYLTPTISSDMKINNKIPIQKSLKGLEAKRTTVVEIYRNSRDRRTRHLRIVPRQQKEKVSRIAAVANTKIRSMFFLKSFKRQTENADTDNGRVRTESFSSNAPRSSSRVAFAREDSNSGYTGHRGRSDSQLSNAAFQTVRDQVLSRAESQMSNICNVPQRENSHPLMTLARSDSQLSQPASPLQRSFNQVTSSTPNALLDRRQAIQKNGWVQNDLNESFNSNQSKVHRKQSFSSVVSATIFANELRKAIKPENERSKLGFVAPKRIESQTDTRKIVKQQMIKDRELDDNMNNWRKRMAIRSSVSSKGRIKAGGRMKLI